MTAWIKRCEDFDDAGEIGVRLNLVTMNQV
jgi:hypothetical protein